VNIGSIVGGIVKTVGQLFGGSGQSDSPPSPTPSYGYSGQSSFDPSSPSSSAAGASGSSSSTSDPDWFKKAVMQVIISNLTSSLDKAKEDFKKAFPQGL
jgi:hypothetical protein